MLIIEGQRIPLNAGHGYFIERGTLHGGEVVAGTRTIHCFNGTAPTEWEAELLARLIGSGKMGKLLGNLELQALESHSWRIPQGNT